MWWSGLRGAIAFALSLQAVQDLPGTMQWCRSCVQRSLATSARHKQCEHHCPPPVCCSADGKGEVMLTCTFFIILITVLVNGGACAEFIDRLHLRAQDSSSRQAVWHLHARAFAHTLCT